MLMNLYVAMQRVVVVALGGLAVAVNPQQSYYYILSSSLAITC